VQHVHAVTCWKTAWMMLPCSMYMQLPVGRQHGWCYRAACTYSYLLEDSMDDATVQHVHVVTCWKTAWMMLPCSMYMQLPVGRQHGWCYRAACTYSYLLEDSMDDATVQHVHVVTCWKTAWMMLPCSMYTFLVSQPYNKQTMCNINIY